MNKQTKLILAAALLGVLVASVVLWPTQAGILIQRPFYSPTVLVGDASIGRRPSWLLASSRDAPNEGAKLLGFVPSRWFGADTLYPQKFVDFKEHASGRSYHITFVELSHEETCEAAAAVASNSNGGDEATLQLTNIGGKPVILYRAGGGPLVATFPSLRLKVLVDDLTYLKGLLITSIPGAEMRSACKQALQIRHQ